MGLPEAQGRVEGDLRRGSDQVLCLYGCVTAPLSTSTSLAMALVLARTQPYL